jgi:hypothetical protein
MNCPHCTSPSAEGKKFCADCGSPLDPEAVRIEALVKNSVETFVAGKFKDQQAVESEIEIKAFHAVIERAEKWFKIFLLLMGVPITVTLGIFAFVGIKAENFNSAINSSELEIRQKMAQANQALDEAQSKASSAKDLADQALATSKNATDEVTQQIASAKGITGKVERLEKEYEAQKQSIARATEIAQQAQKEASSRQPGATFINTAPTITEVSSASGDGMSWIVKGTLFGASPGHLYVLIRNRAAVSTFGKVPDDIEIQSTSWSDSKITFRLSPQDCSNLIKARQDYGPNVATGPRVSPGPARDERVRMGWFIMLRVLTSDGKSSGPQNSMTNFPCP